MFLPDSKYRLAALRLASTFGAAIKFLTQAEVHISTLNHQVNIILPAHSGKAEAFLLSSAGEVKEKFVLHSGHNHILLNHHTPGAYAVRIETNNWVTVKRIILSA